jgi:isopentenyl diphosphate isomerase/L-lactate dehydrogenase-like FMN-dependent dehydrogenase
MKALKHQRGNSRRNSLLVMRKRKGVTEFARTDIGEFFYDVVLSKKTLKWLARKWELPLPRLRNLRKVGRERMVG